MTLEKIKLGLPFGLGEVELKPDDVAKKIAWDLYIELATRVATQDPGDKGIDRDILSSL